MNNVARKPLKGLLAVIARGFLVKALAVPLSFISGVLLARLMGSDQYGLYGLLISIATVVCSGVIRFNSVLLVREISAALERKENKYITGTILLTLVICILCTFLTIVLSSFLERAGVEVPDYLSIAVFLMLMVSFVGSILRGFHRTTAGLFIEQASRPLIQTLVILILAGGAFTGVRLSLDQGVSSLIVGFGLSALIGMVIAIWIFSKEAYVERPALKRNWLVGSMPSLMTLGWIQGLNSQLPVLMLGALATSSAIANYRVADGLAGLISLSLIAVNVALGPRISAARAANDMVEFQYLIRVGATVVTVIALPLAVIFSLFGDFIIPLVFGEEYGQAAGVFVILCFSQLVNSLCGPVMLALNMLSRESENVKAIVIALTLTASSGFVLIPEFGIKGAAISQLLGMCMWNLYLVWKLYQLEKIICLPLFWKRDHVN